MAAKKKKQKSEMPKRRNPVAEIARARTSAGYMTNRNVKRQAGRKAWRKLLDKLLGGE